MDLVIAILFHSYEVMVLVFIFLGYSYDYGLLLVFICREYGFDYGLSLEITDPRLVLLEMADQSIYVLLIMELIQDWEIILSMIEYIFIAIDEFSKFLNSILYENPL